MSLSQTRSIVETRMAIGGKSLSEHNEILGLDAALKYINATLVNRYNVCQVIRDYCKKILRLLNDLEILLFIINFLLHISALRNTL